MKILHCCLNGPYTEGYTYQENLLSAQNKRDGHEVMIIASMDYYVDNKQIGQMEPCRYLNEMGITVVRVPYKKMLLKTLEKKIRAFEGVQVLLDEFEPDVILFHGIGMWELLTIRKYVKSRSGVKLFVDTHASYLNSGRNWISKNILHKVIYTRVIQKALPYVEKVLCIGTDELSFAREMYHIPEQKLELYPLGGIIEEDAEYLESRRQAREERKLDNDNILFVHSGKLDKAKKTCELIQAFSRVENDKARLVIAGSLFPDVEQEALKLINADSRIEFAGWKSGAQLLELLNAADVYLQPGTPSATLQNAACARCAIVAQPLEIYRYILQEQAWFVESERELQEVFEEIKQNPQTVNKKRQGAFERAKLILDYKELAKRIY